MTREQYETATLRDAYDELEHEMMRVHENLEVPTCTPARLEYRNSPETDAGKIVERFEESELSFIDVTAVNGKAWYEFSVSATVFDEEKGESCRLSASTAGVTVLKKQGELSFETFEKVVSVVSDAVGTEVFVCD